MNRRSSAPLQLHHRDHLRSAHDHLACALGKSCCGAGHAHLGEAWRNLDSRDEYRLIIAHDAIARALDLPCAIPNTLFSVDANPKQSRAPAPRQVADAFGSGKQLREAALLWEAQDDRLDVRQRLRAASQVLEALS